MTPSQELLNFCENRRLSFRAGGGHTVEHAHTPFHRHNSFELVYHLRCGGQTRLPHGEPLAYDQGSVIFYPPGVAHDQSMTPPIQDVCIHFDVKVPPPSALQKLIHIPAPLDVVIHEEILHFLKTPPRVSREQQLVLDYRITALVIRLLMNSLRETAVGSPREFYVERAQAYIQSHFDRIEDIEEVANHVGVSHHYLRHVFKPACGLSLVQQLNEVRIARAMDLLIHSTLPLKTIATLSGFQNASYFSTRFRRKTSQSPGAFRSSHRWKKKK